VLNNEDENYRYYRKDILDNYYYCNLFRNSEYKTNPLNYDSNGNIIVTTPKNIQIATYNSLKTKCDFDKYKLPIGPLNLYLSCNGKDCEKYISNDDKKYLCQYLNYPSIKCNPNCNGKCDLFDNTKCMSDIDYNKLNSLCNIPKDYSEFKLTDNILKKHQYCLQNQLTSKYVCSKQSGLDLLTKIPIRNTLEENCNSTGSFGNWKNEYRDDYFGWNNGKLDINNDNCGTRSEALARDAIDYEKNVWGSLNTKCSIGDGKWYNSIEDRYFTNKKMLDIDHHVPLHNAYISGACLWNDKNLANHYANDMTPGHLVTLPYTMNSSKSDKSPDKWMPYKYRFDHLNTLNSQEINKDDCKYANDWIAVKYRYNLSMTQSEKDELLKVLNNNVCKEEKNKYPSYPIFKYDPIGFTNSIVLNNKNTNLLYPIFNFQNEKIKEKLKIKWLDKNRNENINITDKYNEIYNDIINNFESLGIHVKKFIYELNNSSQPIEQKYNLLYNIIIS
jgi:hypothetical protein